MEEANPQRVYEELGGDPAAEEYPSGNVSYSGGFEEEWIIVADQLDYTDPLVSTVMDEVRRFIAIETGHDEDVAEKTDTTLVGLLVQLLDTGDAETVVPLTTDEPAGRAVEVPLSNHGFGDRIEYRYVSEEYLETVTAAQFR